MKLRSLFRSPDTPPKRNQSCTTIELVLTLALISSTVSGVLDRVASTIAAPDGNPETITAVLDDFDDPPLHPQKPPLSQPLQQTINVTSVHPTEDVTRSIERQQKQKLLLGETGSQVWFVLQYERHENNLDYRATCIINGIPMQLKITGNDLPDFAQQEPQNGDFGTTQIHDLLLETGTKQMLKDIAGKLLASGNRIIQDKRAELGELGALKMLTQLDTLEDEIQTAVESELNQIPEIQILQEAGFTISLRSKGLVEIAITRDPLPHPPQAELFAWTKLFQSTPPTPSREDVAQTHAQ